MKWKNMKVRRGHGKQAVLCLGILLTAVGTAAAQSSESASTNAPVGTWTVQVTPRNCATNAAAAAPIQSLVTLHRGGTLSESAGSLSFAVGQRSSGHGRWTSEGNGIYRQRMVALILFDTPPNLPGTPGFNPGLPVSPGFFAGWQTVTHTLQFDDGGNLMSAGTNEFYKFNGDLYRAGCSTAVGQRFE